MYNDRELLAKTLMAEAGNQGPLGMLAAGSVIMNRVRSGNYGQGLQGVILKPGAFSPWNSVTGFAGGEQGQDMARITPSEQAYRIADALLSGQYEDPTGNATHFYNPDISDPSWGIRGGNEWRRIGEHVFGRADDRAKGPSRVINVGSDAPKLVASDTMAALGKGGGAVTPDQIAQGAQAQSTGMQDEQRPRGLLGGLFGNPDTMANLALAFNSMRLNPDPNLGAVLTAQMKERREERKSKQELNKTIAMLERIGADPRLIELAKAGYAKEAISQAYKAPKDAKIIEVDGRLVKYDPATGQTTEVYSSGPDNKAIAEARKEFTSQPWVKAFSDQAGAYSRIMKSIEDPSPSGDLALIFNFMKVLDPGSVVREGEFATAANAGSVDERVRGLYNRVISGERLTPEQRADFADRATKLYQGASEVYQGRAEQYAGFATAAGLPVEQVIPDFSYGGGLYKKPLEFQVPPTPEGADPNTWPQVWRSMTDAERREYLKEAGML